MAETSMNNNVGALSVSNPPPSNSPASNEKKADPPFAWFINIVDSRFLDYDKPMTLALIIGSLTTILAIMVLILQLSTDLFTVTTKSDSVTYPQFYGGMWAQRRWYGQVTSTVTESTDTGETTTTTALCINLISITVPVPASCTGVSAHQIPNTGACQPSMKFFSNTAANLGVPYMENCWPGDEFMNGQTLNTNVEPAVWNGDNGGAVTMALCPARYDQYRVSLPDDGVIFTTGVSRTGGDEIKKLETIDPARPAYSRGMLDAVTCSPTNFYNGVVPWVVEYKQTITVDSKTKPSFLDAVGTAFAYSAYIQVLLTAVILNSMLLSGSVKQTGEDGIDDSAAMKDIAMEMGGKAMGGNK
jgi:hypothetical protein